MTKQVHNTPQNEYFSVLQSAECRKSDYPSCFDVVSVFNSVTVYFN